MPTAVIGTKRLSDTPELAPVRVDSSFALEEQLTFECKRCDLDNNDSSLPMIDGRLQPDLGGGEIIALPHGASEDAH